MTGILINFALVKTLGSMTLGSIISPAVVILLVALSVFGGAKASYAAEEEVKKTTKLPELVVDGRKNHVLHIIAYLREYSTLSYTNDTVMLFREKTVDFMAPTAKAKGFKGWTMPRVLATQSYYHFSNWEGLDSVSKFYRNHFSWSDWVGIFDRLFLPESVAWAKEASDTIWRDSIPISIWNKADESMMVSIDALADRWSEPWAKVLFENYGSHIDFNHVRLTYRLQDVTGDQVYPWNLHSMLYDVESYGRGEKEYGVPRFRDIPRIRTVCELYVAEREFLSEKEAERWRKHPPSSDEIGIVYAMSAPRLPDEIAALVLRCDTTDFDALRARMPGDTAFINRKLLEDRLAGRRPEAWGTQFAKLLGMSVVGFLMAPYFQLKALKKELSGDN